MKKFWIYMILTILVAFMTIGCTASQKASSKTPSAVRANINDAVWSLEYPDINQFKSLIKEAHEKRPQDVFVMNDMGVVYELEGNIPEAKAHYQECIQKAGDTKIGTSYPAKWVGKPLKDLCAANLKRFE
jgi:Tfp pilus assembly protein PilF